jgi:hypothetical protein
VRFGSLRAITVDTQGRPVVAAGNQVWRIETFGGLTLLAGTGTPPSNSSATIGPAEEANISPVDVAFDSSGILHIANDSPASNIVRLAPEGADSVLETYAGGDPPAASLEPTATRFSPDAIVFDADDRMYVGENSTGYEIARLLPEGGLPADTASFRFSSDDRVGASDDAIGTDGQPDNLLDVTFDGVVADVIVTVCSADGTPSSSHWDTVTGDDPMPDGFEFDIGSQTWVVGVSRAAGAVLNGDDGDLDPIDLEEPTRMTLYMQNDGSIETDAQLCVFAIRPDGSQDEQRFTIRGF